jgi:hypothetical protein
MTQVRCPYRPKEDIPAALLYVRYSLNSDQKADFATAVANGR